MSRLIILSNRVQLPDNHPNAGGLAVALNDILQTCSGIWMGWNGCIVDVDGVNDETVANDFESRVFSFLPHQTVTYVTTALTTTQYQAFYCGFANNVLWPLLHERSDFISQTLQDYDGYQKVNRLFAEQLRKIVKPEDVIWVHDYHFLSVAYYCRQLGINNRIGFFLHVPFPALSFWQQLDASANLMTHLVHYDVIGTQTQQDKHNCFNVCKYYLDNTYHTKQVQSQPRNLLNKLTLQLGVQSWGNLGQVSHQVVLDAYPIGINVAKIQQQVADLSLLCANNIPKSSANDSVSQTLSASPSRQIIAVDRIDYSKGLIERFSAYHEFLREYPKYQNKLDLLQIACPSRLDLPAYRRFYNTVRQTVNEVNAAFAIDNYQALTDYQELIDYRGAKVGDVMTAHETINWQAVIYSETVLNHSALMKAFWHSDIGWVNSLKDGMNLVAKEYIAAQNPEDPGVLLLSCYAGANEQMQAAVTIDPHQPNSIIQGLETALTMPLAQRKERYHDLIQGLRKDDLQAWQQRFLNDLYGDSVINTR